MSNSEYVLYAGSYAASERPGIYVFAFNARTGEPAERGSIGGISNPSFITLHPNSRWLYAVGETSEQTDGAAGSVWALEVDAGSWGMRRINSQPSGGDWPCHVAIDATGRWVVVSNYATGSVGVLPILDRGALGETTDLVQHQGSGPHPDRQEGPHAHSALFSPDNCFVVVADLGIDKLMVYRFDAALGKLAEHTSAATRPGAGPRHMAFHPGGQILYVANELDSTVGVYGYDKRTAELRERQVVTTLPPGAPENTVADIHVAPSGKRLYVSNRGHDSLAAFDIEQDGSLRRVDVSPCGGRWPRNFAISPDGRFVLVANQHSDEITVFRVPAGEQGLGEPVARVAVPGVSCVQFAAGREA